MKIGSNVWNLPLMRVGRLLIMLPNQLDMNTPVALPTPFEDFLWLAREFPDLKIILAHAGGLFPFYELNPKIRPELKNIYYDLAACPLLYEPSLYRKLIEVVGPEKILWGTDYPLRIFPKTQRAQIFRPSKILLKTKPS